MNEPAFRKAIRDYICSQAKPPDKLSHQARLHRLAHQLAGETPFDDDVLFAAAWLHDLGVFIGHRPEEPEKLARWDHLAYVLARAPALLRNVGFPEEKLQPVLEAIRTHLPSGTPTSLEGKLLRDADILEQLGATGILRIVSKVGRDTRFTLFSDALRVLRQNLERLPQQCQLPAARSMAKERADVLQRFLAEAEAEAAGIQW